MKTISRTVAALWAMGWCSAVFAETDYNTFKEKTAEVRKTEHPAVADITDWNTFNKR